MYFRFCGPHGASCVCISKRRQRYSRNCCIHSNQILLSDKDQQLHTYRELHTGAGSKSAIYDCLVCLSVCACEKFSRTWHRHQLIAEQEASLTPRHRIVLRTRFYRIYQCSVLAASCRICVYLLCGFPRSYSLQRKGDRFAFGDVYV